MSQVAKDNLHHDVAGEDIFASKDARFLDYRRRWEDNPRNLEYGEFPLHLDIEVTSLCNLRCPFCATTYSKDAISNGYMSRGLVHKILDEGAEHGLCACKFNFRGEPLLHKQLPEFVAYAKDKGVLDVFFNTNGFLLTEDKIHALIEARLDRLTLSFEGATKPVYESYRVGSDFERVVRNIETLQEVKARLGVDYPKVRVQSVLVPEVKNNLQDYIDFWEPRADQVSYNEMLDNVPGSIELVESDWVCPFPYQRMMIMWDGTVTTCYNDHYGKNAVGNANENSLHVLWDEHFSAIRQMHRERKAHESGACAECPLRYNEITK